MHDETPPESTTLAYLAVERWIPDWSAMWPEIADLQRRGLVRIRWEEHRNSARAMVMQVRNAA